MALIERPAILSPALTLGEREAMDFLPDVGPGIADGLFCHRPLVGSEQVRKTDRHDRPFAVFLVPERVLPQQRMDLGIAVGGEVETSMPCCHVGDDALGVNDRHLRSAPWCAYRHAGLHAVQLGQIAFVTSGLGDARTEFRFIRHPAVMPDEICPRQIGEWPTDRTGACKERKAAL